MNTYHKIQNVYKRDPDTRKLIPGEYATEYFAYLADLPWIATEKVDGTNIRVIVQDGTVTFKGKTDAAVIPPFLLESLANLFHPIAEYLVAQFPDGACLYGEGYGAKIQKVGAHYRQDQGFVLFDVRIGRWWLMREDVELLSRIFMLDVVPVVKVASLPELVQFVSDGFSSQWGPFPAEGVVARPAMDLQERSGARIITKIKTKEFR